MGVYDTVLVPCPNCGELYGAQSKSGECSLGTYRLRECPDSVLMDVNRHAPFVCEKCNTIFEVELKTMGCSVQTKTPCPKCGKIHGCYDCENFDFSSYLKGLE